MDSEKYKQHIESEYKRLFETKKEEGEKIFYHFVMYGSEGLEGYVVDTDPENITGQMINRMCLRARFNAHRSVGVYAFSANQHIPEKCINKAFLKKESVFKFY